jgi:hypothetical protein
MRDVINVFYGVPSAKLLQTSKKMYPLLTILTEYLASIWTFYFILFLISISPAVELAGRVFSVVTKQRTLEILADSVDQRKIWVAALVSSFL